MDKRVRNFYDKYWDFRISVNKLYTNETPKRLIAACSMIKKDESPGRLLDVGCGEGTLGKILRQKFRSDIYLVGIDISRKAVELATPYYDETHCLDIEDSNLESLYGENTFNYVVCLEVLEHVFYPAQLLERIRAVTKEHGAIISSFPNFAFYKYRIKALKGQFPEEQHFYSDVEHLHYFTVPSFIKLLSETGLEPVEIDGEFAAPFFARFLPQAIMMPIMKRYPNFFGVQLVIKAAKRGKVG